MAQGRNLLAELKRRNVWRAAAVYVAAVWALAQGIAQLSPAFGMPDWVTRWFVIACIIGFPFWIAFAWFYAWTPQGLKRESEIATGDSIAHSTGRKLDYWIIGIMAIAIVLLLTNALVWHKGAGLGANVAAAPIPVKSIAVLPFADESADKNQQYFSDGLSEDLITALSQFAGLKVIGRDSSFQFRNSKDDSQTIGAKLGVAHLLEGSVQRAGDEVRISAELINAADGSTLWSQRYDRPYKDLFKLQDDITKAVAAALKSKLLPGRSVASQSDRPPSGNLGAYNAFLQGRFYGSNFSLSGLRKAIGFYKQAITLDPGYATAYAYLTFAQIYLGMRLTGPDRQQAFAKGRAAAATALALAPDLGDAHAAHAVVLSLLDRDVVGALDEDRRGLTLDPHSAAAMNVVANDLAIVGHLNAAVAMYRKAITASPMQGLPYSNQAYALSALGHLDEAEQAARHGVALSPTSQFAQEVLANVELLRGNTNAALQWAAKEPDPYQKLWYQTAAYIVAGNHAKADAALQTLLAQYASEQPYSTAQLYALRKQPDAMFAWLDRAAAQRDPNLTGLLTDAFVLPYKSDPRFAALCKKVGLPLPGEKLPAVATSSAAPAAASTP